LVESGLLKLSGGWWRGTGAAVILSKYRTDRNPQQKQKIWVDCFRYRDFWQNWPV